jgi:hypothetical protein
LGACRAGFDALWCSRVPEVTVFFRSATPALEDEVTPNAPTLAMLCERIVGRAPIFDGEAVIVDDCTYEAAEAEMKAIFLGRGYSDIARAQLSNRNFLLFGIPICRGD